MLGKPIGIVGTAWLASRLAPGRLRIPVGWAALAGTGAIAGIGFTVSLLIASLAFHGPELQEAKLGVLSAAMLASVLAWMIFRLTARLSPARRTRALLGTVETLIDLAAPVDEDRDHIRGPADAKVTLVEYGDFECPYCGQAEPVVRTLLHNMGDLRYVWRHLPLTDVHPNAALSAEAAEAADRQGAFWPMHDLLLEHQQELRPVDLVRYAAELGLDVDRFREDLRRHVGAARVAEDVDSAGSSGWRAPRRFSSTAAASTAPTTSTPSPRRSRRQRLRRSSRCPTAPVRSTSSRLTREVGPQAAGRGTLLDDDRRAARAAHHKAERPRRADSAVTVTEGPSTHRTTVTDVQIPAGTFRHCRYAHLLTTSTTDRLRELYPLAASRLAASIRAWCGGCRVD